MRGVLLVGAAVLAGCGRKEPGADAVPAEPARAEPAPGLPFGDVANAYERNPVEADARFKGKRWRVTGVKVWHISRAKDGRPYVAPVSVVGRFDPPPTYYFYLKGDAGAVGVERGSVLDLEGVCEGFRRDGLWRGLDRMDWRVEFGGCAVATP
jgi:hypothetical protein